jgi:hypothetical protein
MCIMLIITFFIFLKQMNPKVEIWILYMYNLHYKYLQYDIFRIGEND